MKDNNQEVTVTDIRMPFGSMVLFMVKWALASVPAMIIFVAIRALVWTGLLALFSPATPTDYSSRDEARGARYGEYGSSIEPLDRASDKCRGADDQSLCMGALGFKWDGFKWVLK